LTDENDEERQVSRRIEARLKKIERDLAASSEDQIFFGLVIALLIFLVTIPYIDLQKPFEEVLRFTGETSRSLALTIKYAGVVCLIVAGVARYYGVIVGHARRSKTARVLSIECLIMAWDAFLFSFVLSTVFHLSAILGITTVPLAAALALGVSIGMARVERRVLGFYASRYLIFKKDVTPIASNSFQWLAWSLYFAFFSVLALVLHGRLASEHFAAVFLVAWMVLFVVFTLLSRRKWRRVRRAVSAWRLRA
jgi:hypothetical protein